MILPICQGGLSTPLRCPSGNSPLLGAFQMPLSPLTGSQVRRGWRIREDSCCYATSKPDLRVA